MVQRYGFNGALESIHSYQKLSFSFQNVFFSQTSDIKQHHLRRQNNDNESQMPFSYVIEREIFYFYRSRWDSQALIFAPSHIC